MNGHLNNLILGLDPGLTCTGWGLIRFEMNRLSFVDAGVIKSSAKENMPARLANLFQNLADIIQTHRPYEASVEQTFVNQNPASALKLGHARGVALLAPAYFNMPVYEYTANQVKKAVVGQGHADKDQVMAMVHRLLPMAKNVVKSYDAGDALAIAICHAHTGHINKLIKKA
jgi:crossover junction endodeoxyribonuclease RuvC